MQFNIATVRNLRYNFDVTRWIFRRSLSEKSSFVNGGNFISGDEANGRSFARQQVPLPSSLDFVTID